MGWYVAWVHENLLLSAFIQFAILGTLGELLGIVAAKGKPSSKALEWIAKAVVWGLLGILIKYAFTGFRGFRDFLASADGHNLLPAIVSDKAFPGSLLGAFCLSFFANSMFGPLLMFLHRSTDNLIARTEGYQGIDKSLWTLAWFWLPAHTVTFILPPDLQIGLAALWSVALGLIMGMNKRKA